ncbi:MAG: Fic family protein [Endomicrobium sp.]|nr:Fic family protein [Endomicrobium sp.]
MKNLIGTYRLQPERFMAFIPNPFPPKLDNLPITIIQKHTEAVRLLGKLDGITQILPDKDCFLEMFVRKDASSSSQIEGTRATMIDAIEALNVDKSSNIPSDVDDILHYIDALNYGLTRAVDFPFTLRFIKELHSKLMVGARSTHHAYPGEFRSTQNWIGGTRPDNARFVPPPVSEMVSAMNDFENFIHDDKDFMPLIKAALLHAQFETIHPFVDGNGRTGRMIVTMYLWHKNFLESPVLYLSAYFKRHQEIYYEKLDSYHNDKSDVSGWIDFFLDGIIDIAKESIATCREIMSLREQDMHKLASLGKGSAESTMKVLKELYRIPTVGVSDIAKWTGFTQRGADKVIERLEKMGILEPLNPNENYARKFIYKKYVNLFFDKNNTR